MADRAVFVEHDGYTVDAHRTCGAETCVKEVMIKLGVPVLAAVELESGSRKSYTFKDGGGFGDVVITTGDPGDPSGDAYCVWCGDFLEHGTDCTHADKGTELPPMSFGVLNPTPGRMNHSDYPGRYSKP